AMEITLKQLSPDFQRLITEMGQSNESINITDEGTPLAILSPTPQKKRAAFGCMKETIQILDDIVAPAVPESAWEVLQ
ncbi:hypothetical protein, partial [Picosynechococcus sp. PCC 7002]|uniref:hypothetical protein n=1 Tax=Picosynechococcus sp. (strain ATCC 27264 / PCC 7002 / PR-6) TaxID=32049 RepID=UPI001C3C9EF6